ncbi:MAG: sulfurtransferase TusA family protein [Thiotrichales bacterium]|nr:sulfurtransferase TusA family protein [Thiotrichales bacterium]
MMELDCTALACPMPVIKLKKALSQYPEQQVFCLSLRDRGGLRDIPAFCQHQGLGCELVSEESVLVFKVVRPMESLK